jgi:hypothetical protein
MKYEDSIRPGYQMDTLLIYELMVCYETNEEKFLRSRHTTRRELFQQQLDEYINLCETREEKTVSDKDFDNVMNAIDDATSVSKMSTPQAIEFMERVIEDCQSRIEVMRESGDDDLPEDEEGE